MVVVGGMASIWGSVLGAALLSLLPELLARFEGYETHRVRRHPGADHDLPAARHRAEPGRPLLPRRGLSVLRVEHLSKSFGGVAAVSDVSFCVERRRHPRGHRPERRGQDDACST